MKKYYYLCFLGGMWGIVLLFSRMAYRFDKDFTKKSTKINSKRTLGFLSAGCVSIAAALWSNISGIQEKQELLFCGAAAGVFAGCLVFACITDRMMFQVYDFCWWLSIPAVFYLWEKNALGLYELAELAVFFLIQQVVFTRFLGKADCHAFCVCAMFESTVGMDAEGFFRHMILAYGILIIHQIYKNNIGGKGRLKKAVPFVPYIAASFFLNILQLPGQF